MRKETARGFAPDDPLEFGPSWAKKMERAAEELVFLLDRGYGLKQSVSFVGNHHFLSERQRRALGRVTASGETLSRRKEREMATLEAGGRVHIDGFNTIITLETALSGSLLLEGMDGCIRDLAGLRGTYRIIDKTAAAISLVLQHLERAEVGEAVLYLDAPVSNSGRLKSLVLELACASPVRLQVLTINQVDRTLSEKECVVTSDGGILDRCGRWYNMNGRIIRERIPQAWVYRVPLEKGRAGQDVEMEDCGGAGGAVGAGAPAESGGPVGEFPKPPIQ
ncbi:DUF434 domain-containing protein [Anaerotalea alkaliphila]|uniref:DUF434 domain-containing protein n=1 Tax=Anaerotalea alkaliphila TaxID=2662126 RepID=A0A7X5HVL3_9FIRM|nr:DUF434 domain-containing protein [Anaerotalea alkaliphila]NDL67478.1 DUF434 domain-containing protein [Anaerotalea alkaliphila]